MLALFIRHEGKRQSQGEFVLMPRSFFKTKAVRCSLVAVAYGFFVAGALNIAVVPYLQIVNGASGMQVGVLLACAGIAMVALGASLPKLKPDASPRFVIRIGYVTGAFGFFILAFCIEGQSLTALVAAGMLLVGAAIGIVNSQANYAVAFSVGERDAQQSGGMQGTMRDIAHSLSVALLGTLLAVAISLSFSVGVQAPGTELSNPSVESLQSASVELESNEAFLASEAMQGIDSADSEIALQIFYDARLFSERLIRRSTGMRIACAFGIDARNPQRERIAAIVLQESCRRLEGISSRQRPRESNFSEASSVGADALLALMEPSYSM